MFEQLLRATLHDARRPMKSPEIIEAFRKRGHPIRGNETRTAWNRLWKAKANGMLITIPRFGYWLADEQLPDGALDTPPPKRKRLDPEVVRDIRGIGRKIGRQRLLTDSQVKLLERWLADGTKTRAEMARDLGGVSIATIGNYRTALLRKRDDQTLDDALKELFAAAKKKQRGSGRSG
jgi:DNA-binding CsgD family transcriptional regulator